MPTDDMGSRRARAKPQKGEDKKSRWKKRRNQFIAVLLILIMTMTSLVALITQY